MYHIRLMILFKNLAQFINNNAAANMLNKILLKIWSVLGVDMIPPYHKVVVVKWFDCWLIKTLVKGCNPSSSRN